jgi:phenylpyruvate C(3)-methyltransferase
METARLFNSALASFAISSAFELGLLEELHSKGMIHTHSFCDNADLHQPTVASVIHVLACFKIVELSSDAEFASRGPIFADVYRQKGYFFWLVKGYGSLLQNLAELAKCSNRSVDNDLSFVHRSLNHIAIAGRDYGSQFVDRYFEDLLDEQAITVACDLGCGSAERLLKMAKKYPGARGIGIDVSKEVLAVAQNRIEAESLQDRLMVIEADMKSLSPRQEFADVSLLFSFFLGHDLWPRPRCKEVFERLFTIFPHVQRFLFCDTYRSVATTSPDIPTFTLGFELTHAVMGQYIPSEAEWLTLFEETGWRCVAKLEVEIPFSAIFDLRPR